MSNNKSQTALFPINLDKLTDKERHNYILNQYVIPTAAEVQSRKHKRDIDVIRENHKFLWSEDADEDIQSLSWEQRLALRYYRKLFKEYCIADLSRYKENKIALRWRTEQEVVTGIGQFQCGSRHCGVREELRSWEVNFKYIEQGTSQNALVKEYKRQRRREKEDRKAEIKLKRRKLNERADDSVEPEESKDKIQEETKDEAESDTPQVGAATANEDVWSKQIDISKEEPSRELEFERYLEDLLL